MGKQGTFPACSAGKRTTPGMHACTYVLTYCFAAYAAGPQGAIYPMAYAAQVGDGNGLHQLAHAPATPWAILIVHQTECQMSVILVLSPPAGHSTSPGKLLLPPKRNDT